MMNFYRQFLVALILTGSAFPVAGAETRIQTGNTGNLKTGVTGTRVQPGAAGKTAVSVATSPVNLSAYAEELAKILKFDRNVLVLVKKETQGQIHRLIGFDEDGYQIFAPGITVPVPEDRTDSILESLRKKLLPLQYMAFVVEINSGLKIDKIGILKGTDQYEILRIMQTGGEEYDITNQDVIDRLKEWEKIASFDIIGADSDWVEIEFESVPKDLHDFAGEVYEFCPDAVDQGPGSVEGLIKEIKRTKRLFLWWD
jgi:hypothetical protein